MQAKPNEPGTKQLPRQLQKQAYNEALIKRYKHLPEVRRIERHRHIPKPLYKVKLIALMLLSTLDCPSLLLPLSTELRRDVRSPHASAGCVHAH